jgi:flagellar biosynthetic protein FliQ
MIASLVGVLRDGFLLALLLVAPILVAALIAGVLSGLLAAFTQMQDPAVALVPRVAAVGAAIALFAPSIAAQLVTFAHRIWPLIIAAGSGGAG